MNPKHHAQKTGASPDPLTRELRSAIADDGRAHFAIATEAGISPAAVHRFMSRERSLSLESADKLAAALGLQLVRKGRTKARVKPDSDS